jgi:hypothetical protein
MIPGHEVFRYWVSLQYEGTIYEGGIDNSTRIKRLFEKVESLERVTSELSKENRELRVKLGLEDDVPSGGLRSTHPIENIRVANNIYCTQFDM